MYRQPGLSNSQLCLTFVNENSLHSFEAAHFAEHTFTSTPLSMLMRNYVSLQVLPCSLIFATGATVGVTIAASILKQTNITNEFEFQPLWNFVRALLFDICIFVLIFFQKVFFSIKY